MTSGKTILGSKIAYLDPSELAREAAVARLGVPGAVSLPLALPSPVSPRPSMLKGCRRVVCLVGCAREKVEAVGEEEENVVQGYLTSSILH
jgi:hypothetical protein